MGVFPGSVLMFPLCYRPGFNKPPFPKRNHYVNTKLEVRKIPRELNNITKLGTIVNIQVTQREAFNAAFVMGCMTRPLNPSYPLSKCCP